MALAVRRVFFTGLLLLVCGLAFGQRLTGVIKGRVVDSTGLPLPGVVLTLNSPALMTPDLPSTSNERGEFRFPLLDPGVYEVRAELMGFAPLVRENVRLTVGSTAELRLELQPELGETVVVTTAGPTVDTESSSTGVNFTQELLQSIPTNRDAGVVFNSAPGVDGFSTHGASVRSNSYLYDGVDISDPTVGTAFVGYNYDNLEELQVETGGHTAEYGQVAGAVAQIVTKSGGNDYSGGASIYYQNDSLTSENGQRITERFPDLKPGGILKKVDTQAQLGGPILRDKVWFFGSWRYVDRDSRVVGFDDGQGQPIPVSRREDFGFIKATLQPSPSHKIVGSLNYQASNQNNRGASSLRSPEATGSMELTTWTPSAEWTAIFTPNTFAQLRFAAVDYVLNIYAGNDRVRRYNTSTGQAFDSYGWDDLNNRKRKQLTLSLSHYRELAGTHDFKLGFEYEASEVWRDLTYNRGGWPHEMYGYEGVSVYETNRDGQAVPYYATFLDGPPNRRGISRVGLYFQDTWVVQDRLTLNLGLRVDGNEGYFPEQETATGEAIPPIRDVISQTDVSPRLGVAYDIGGGGTSVLRASYSRVVDALIHQYIAQVNPSAISWERRAFCEGPLGHLCQPGQVLSDPYYAYGGSNTRMDPDARLPKANEYIVGYEQELASNLSFSANYIERNEFDLLEDITLREFVSVTAHDPGDTEVDLNGNVVDTSEGGPIGIWDYADPDAEDEWLITNPPVLERGYRGLELVLNKRMSDRWQLLASFTIARSSGNAGTSFGWSSSISAMLDNPNELINANGLLELNRTYQLKLQGTYQLPYGINLSGYYRALSGRPYTRICYIWRFDSDGDGVDDTPLSMGRAVIWPEKRGSRQYDPLHLLDLRVEKEFRLASGSLGLVFDVYNLFNIDTITSRRTHTAGAGLRFGDPLAFHAPRELSLGARYQF